MICFYQSHLNGYKLQRTTILTRYLGAPAIACMNMRPMHGLNRPKPASASQFFIRQSSLNYLPGETIEVDLMTYSESRNFRGFLLQAQDPHTGHHIGHFAPTKESRPIDTCSATTHRDNSEKQHVKLVWLSPGASLPPGTDLGAPSHGNSWHAPIQPSINLSLLHKRQLVSVSTNVTNISNSGKPDASASNKPADIADIAETSTPTQAEHGAATSAGILQQVNQSSFAPAKKQVRFRATIVVAYDDFYTGFESSDLRYDPFTFANGTGTTATTTIAST